MSSTPWVIHRDKRKAPSTTPAPRKRARISDDVGRKSGSALRSKSQRTLTQIAFVSSPQTSFEEDVDLEELTTGKGLNEGRQPKAKAQKKPVKRKSTLTQMPWLDRGPSMSEALEDELLPIESEVHSERPAVPQFDGTYNSPRKPRVPKSTGNDPLGMDNTMLIDNNETQEYLPSKRRKRSDINPTEAGTGRRRSGRIASRISNNPDEHLKVFESTLYKSLDDPLRSTTKLQRPVLEIKDSTDFDDDETPQQTRHTQPLQILETPQKRYIASSQTPESQPLTMKRTQSKSQLTPSKSSKRAPLGVRDPNIPSLSLQKSIKNADTKVSPRRRQPNRKICVLKVPSRGLLPRPSRVSDSEDDIYSLQPTSSTGRSKKTPSPPNNGLEEDQMDIRQGHKPTLPAYEDDVSTAPSEYYTNSMENLPQSSNSTSRQAEQEVTVPGTSRAGSSGKSTTSSDAVMVRDFGEDDASKSTSGDVAMMPATPNGRRILPEAVNDTEEDVFSVAGGEVLSDFGTPILNDTQFVADLDQRTSSPTSSPVPPASSKSRHRNRPASNSDQVLPVKQTPNESEQFFATDDPDNETSDVESNTPLPPPRLIRPSTTSTRPQKSLLIDVAEDGQSLPNLNHQSSSTQQIPLKGTSAQFSVPALPSQRMPTQKSIHPASMLRPSQVSTQEPTQHHLLSSIAPDAFYESDDEVDRITIKDSSSAENPAVSQIPVYNERNPSQGLDLSLSFDSEDELDNLDLDRDHGDNTKHMSHSNVLYQSTGRTELDLDPETASRHSARKPVVRSSSGADSALKSIHASSSEHEEQTRSSPPPADSEHADNQLAIPSGDPKPVSSKRKRTFSEEVLDLLDDIPTSSPSPPPLRRKYSPIAGLDNDTQSNFTQGGTVTAAYIHRQREAGLYPSWFVPKIRAKSDKKPMA